jgi:curli biogenesis system outer membrane secretion channel CsgG
MNMKKMVIILAVLSAAHFYCGSGRVSVSQDALKSKGANVAIVGFDMRNKKDSSPVPRVSDEFSDALVPAFMDCGFRVIERKKIDVLLREAELQGSGIVDADGAVRFGKIARVRFVVYGNGLVNPSGSGRDLFLHSVSVKMVDVETGETALAGSWSGAGVRPPDVAEKIGRDMAEKFR